MVERQQTIVVKADVTSALQVARQAVSNCGWKVAKINSSSIMAASGISFTSWGETITVQVKESGNSTYLNVKSKSGFALVDFGKNQQNINKFLAELNRIVPIIK